MAIGANEETGAGQYLPVRMLNEFTYCPRLFFLEWVQGEFVDNHYTVEGRNAHRRVDAGGGKAAAPEDEEPFRIRSLSLSSEKLGLSAKIDLVEGDQSGAIPVDYKRGRPPVDGSGAYEPERVQLCAYGLLLREHGYQSPHGILYFAQSRQRVRIDFDEPLIARTLQLLAEAKETAARGVIPPPLRGSPKCQGCSLNAICLPDEVNHIAEQEQSYPAEPSAPIRRLVPERDDARPLYVQEQGARVGIDGEVLVVKGRDGAKLAEARLFELSQVVLQGNVQISSQAVRELCRRRISISWMSWGGWLAGMSDGLGQNNIDLRRAQFRAADDPARCLSLARRIVRNKVANSRTMLRRNHPRPPESALRELQMAAEATRDAMNLGELLGIEGNAARIYFEHFPELLKPPADGDPMVFDFNSRSRRPPRDPVNALLSFAYAMLARELANTARAVGLDPMMGFYHQPRFGRPALALDLMEEFRPIIADSVVITAVNTGVVTADDFLHTGLGVSLVPEARKKMIRAYERRMEETVTHPVFGYRISYRRVLEVQCRLLGRHLLGELKDYPEFRTR